MTSLIAPSAPVKLCNPKLKQEPWNFDAPLPPHYGPGSSQDDAILPNMAAGCSMADMADADDVLDAWDTLAEVLGTATGQRAPLVPVTYMNSAAALKSFCGSNGGIVCTSSNAERVLRWAFERGERVLFFPDQHLGRNTGYKMGVALDQMLEWDPNEPLAR